MASVLMGRVSAIVRTVVEEACDWRDQTRCQKLVLPGRCSGCTERKQLYKPGDLFRARPNAVSWIDHTGMEG